MSRRARVVAPASGAEVSSFDWTVQRPAPPKRADRQPLRSPRRRPRPGRRWRRGAAGAAPRPAAPPAAPPITRTPCSPSTASGWPALEREAFTKGYAQGERAGLEAGGKRAEAMLRRVAQTHRGARRAAPDADPGDRARDGAAGADAGAARRAPRGHARSRAGRGAGARRARAPRHDHAGDHPPEPRGLHGGGAGWRALGRPDA